MPISHSNKIVFVHVPKTGGQSINNFLGFRKHDSSVLYYQDDKKRLQYTHFTFSEIQRHFNITLDDYYKFCFVRNPYSRFVSQFHHRKRHSKVDRLVHISKLDTITNYAVALYEHYKNGDFNNQYRACMSIPQSSFVLIDGVNMMNDVYRYENFQDDIVKLANRIDCGVTYPRINVANYNKNVDWFDSETRKIVNHIYAKDFELFGYNMIEP